MTRTLLRTLCCVLLLVLLAACGEGSGDAGERPSRSASLSPTLEPSFSPTRTRSPEGGDTEAPTEEPTEAPTETATETETTTVTESAAPSESASPTESPTESEGSGGDSSAEDETPAWVWWLLAALAVALVVGIPLVVRSRRRGAWRAQLAEAESEVAWFARELLPGLRQVASREQVAGGWAVGSARVAAAEDRLTALEPSAPTDADRVRARALRDAVRMARDRMQRLVAPGPHDTWALDLDAIIADLEAALGPVSPPR